MRSLRMVAIYVISIIPCAVAPSDPVALATTIAISGTALEIELLPIHDAAHHNVLLGKTEVPWELLDAFVFSRDAGSGPTQADAIARPTKPYISMDRGFGHAGFPAISVSEENAKLFCVWLSAKTGRTFRLPTLQEFQSACAQGSSDAIPLNDIAWYVSNSNRRTHRIATSKPMSNGFYDLKGNAAEWVTMTDGKGVLVGGAYNDPEDRVNCGTIRPFSTDWNDTDPQIPPSRWWLANGSFAGFRVACEVPLASPTNPITDKPQEIKPSSVK
ncbi:MAG: hypothetical protein DWH76_01570 [Planctomycetota bacterium]|nr:MAG: hypothetical protein DWH76_01570 [Planctomycetota bacterium]